MNVKNWNLGLSEVLCYQEVRQKGSTKLEYLSGAMQEVFEEWHWRFNEHWLGAETWR